jgi:hypothetical protein
MKIIRALLIIPISIIFIGMGGLIGAYFGGNFAVNFYFLGVRGYEAMGLVGCLFGLIGSVMIARIMLRQRTE